MTEKKIVIIFLLSVIVLLLVIPNIFGKKMEEEPVKIEVTLDLISNPEGATIYIEGEGPFTTPQKISILPGTYNFWVFKENYYVLEKNIEIEKENEEIVLILEKLPEGIQEENDFEPQEIDPIPY